MPEGAILLVEDDAGDVAVALRAFRKHRLDKDVVVMRDGAEALEYLRSARCQDDGGPDTPQLILLDLKMPRIDGWQVLRELRAEESTQNVPVVVLSSSDRDADVRESYRLGANSFVRKRFDSTRPGEYLVDIARYWLHLNRALA